MWTGIPRETLHALRAQGDAARGAVTFEVCQGCHRAKALGRTDGSYPRLAGQHDTVLIKQMSDVRAGRRSNPKMLPFIDEHVADPQDIADAAAYVSRLPMPADNGRGPGVDLDSSEKVYQARCGNCHGRQGEGDADRFFPKVAGQHYKYLLRQLRDTRDGARQNSDPRMVDVLKGRADSELDALADYMARLPATTATR